MKKLLTHTMFFLVIAVLISSCHRENILDKRHKYIGNWHFTIIELAHHWTKGSNGIWSSNTSSYSYNYDGSIDYGTNANDLLITYGSGQSVNTGNYKSDGRKKISLSFTVNNDVTNNSSDFTISGSKN